MNIHQILMHENNCHFQSYFYYSDNSYYHFVLSTDNILATSVVVNSAARSSLRPDKIVFHVITDKKTYAAMHSWFALNPVSPAIVEAKGDHQFNWLTRENVPVIEAVENHNGIRNYYHGNHIAVANLSTTTPRSFASKFQSRSPKYISLLNQLRIYLPELFPNLDKVVVVDDDVVIQRDLSPLWEIDLEGKVNGVVETCKGKVEWNLKSKLTVWKLGTLPPALIAFKRSYSPNRPILAFTWLGLSGQADIEDVKRAAVIHYNGQSKPWLEIGFEHLRPFWIKPINYSNEFIRNCHILES